MKLLLTSAGITNDTLAAELEQLAGKKFDDLKIAFVPTAGLCDAGDKLWLINDLHRLAARGASVDVVDIAQLPTDSIHERLAWSNVIFVGGGNTFYLSYCMQKSGMVDMLPELLKARVYVGISAGSMVASQTIRTSSQTYQSEHFYDESYDEYGPAGQSSINTMKWVDFAFRPHLNSRYFPEVTEKRMQDIADSLGVDMYVVDDDCAVKVNADELAVVGDGQWHLLHAKKAS